VIAFPALITTIRHRADEKTNPIQMFFVWLAAYSMLVAAFGMLATIIVFTSYGMIPGTASDGGKSDGKYYFNWHDETYTEVSKQTWQRAWFFEQLSQHFLWVPFGVFGSSLAILFLTRPFFRPRAKASRPVETNC
jgi:hypothetical protein